MQVVGRWLLSAALRCASACLKQWLRGEAAAQEPLQLRNTITISPKGGLHVRVMPRGLEPEP